MLLEKQFHAIHPQRLLIDGDTSMYLRHVRVDDSPEVYRLIRANRNHLVKDQQWAQHIDYVGLDKSVHDTIAQIKADTCLQYRIVASNDTGPGHHIVGTVSLFNKEVLERRAVLSCWLAEKDHGKGYAVKAIRRLLDYAFREWNIDTAVTAVAEDNIRAQKLLTSLGAQKSDTITQREVNDQKPILYRQWSIHA